MTQQETLVLYIIILLICTTTTATVPSYSFKNNSKRAYFYLFASIPIIIYTLFWGLRYDVGADYLNYKGYFSFMPEKIEIGYQFLNKILNNLGFNYVSIFIVTSFFPIYTLFFIARKESKPFAVLLVYFFFTSSLVFFTQNGIRQSIALFFIFILISKIKDSKLPTLITLAILALLFHKSAIVPITFITLLYILKPIRINKYILISLLIILTFTGSKLYDIFFAKFAFMFELLDYSGYEENIGNYESAVKYDSGFGMILKLIINLIVIYNQDKFLQNKEDKQPIYYFYIFFVIGILLDRIIAGNSIFGRMNVYFINSRVIIYAYLCYYLISHKNIKYSIIIAFIIVSMLLLYISSILGNSNICVPYKSIFSTIV